MRAEIDLKKRSVLSELCRREAATMRVMIASRTTSEATKEMTEHCLYLETTADSLMTYGTESTGGGTLIVPTPDIDLRQTDPVPVPQSRTLSETP
jgi:hypothetical protein